MVLNTEWTQLEIIELLNELPSQNLEDVSNIKGLSSGNGGFGFGITGNKSTGVVVKVITPRGSASKDGRLKINDQIFQIGSINVRGMNSEQVAAVLRQSAFHGQYVKFLIARPIHNSLDDFNQILSDEIINLKDENSNNDILNVDLPFSERKSFYIKTSAIIDKKINFDILSSSDNQKLIEKSSSQNPINNSSELDLELSNIMNNEKKRKNSSNLKLDFIENEILKDNDYIIELPREFDYDESKNLHFYINKILNHYGLSIDKKKEKFYVKTIDLLKNKFQSVEIYDQLLEINEKDINNICSSIISETDKISLKFSNNFQLKAEIIQEKWFNYLTSEQDDYKNYIDLTKYDLDIIVSRIDKTKSKNLGISLEGTVDLDDNGIEKFPHHYIRSIMMNGPVFNSKDAKFKEGDELLEIDNIKLYAINYVELLENLKNLKSKSMLLVCARKTKKILKESEGRQIGDAKKEKIINKAYKNLEQYSFKQTKLCFRSRSLELIGPKLWNSKITFINLIKGENGLGFSLIDYQNDPYNPLSKTMIAIRALVPGGVAHLDGRIMPGQRLVSINDYILDEDLFLENENNKIVSLQSFNNRNFSSSFSKIFKINLLNFALNILKKISIGKQVRLGIQNPLPYPDADIQSIKSHDENLNSINAISDSEYLNTDKMKTAIVKKICNDHEQTDSIFKDEYSNNFKQNLNHLELFKSEADFASLKRNYTFRKKLNKKMNYGILTTSAPAILTHSKDEDNALFKFYSSQSQLKVNTLNFLKMKLKSDLNDKLKSCPSILNTDSFYSFENDFECFKSNPGLKKKSKSENLIKDRYNNSLSFALNRNLQKNEKLRIPNCLIPQYYDSLKFFMCLLIDDKEYQAELNIRKIDHQSINEDQFHKAFIKNINKKFQNLVYMYQMEDGNIDTENFEIEDIFSNLIYFEKKKNELFRDPHKDILNLKPENKFNEKNLKEENNSDWLEKIIDEITLYSWPKITEKLFRKNLSNLSKQFCRKNEKRRTLKRRKNTFDEQISVINESRPPSGSRFIRNFSQNSNHFRSKSQGYCSKPKNLAIKNNSMSKITSELPNNIKVINILGKEIVRLPCNLEKEIRIKKNFYPLGIISVDCTVDEGINGCVIKRIESNSACAKDGRLKIGDFLLSVNNEQMRILTNSNARAILNRASLSSKDVVIIYIPFEEAVKVKAKINKIEKKIVSLSSSIFTKSFQSNSASSSSKSLSASLNGSSPTISESSCTSKSVSLESVFSFPKNIEEDLKTKRTSNESVLVKKFKDDLNEKIEILTISKLDDQKLNEDNQTDSIGELDISKTLWGPQRIVILERENNESLGISIVGGKLDISSQKGTKKEVSFITGIFVKHVKEKSPAGKNGMIKTGDRILAVNEIDLSKSSYDKAIAVIINSKSPVKFLIQSLIHIDSHIKSFEKNSSKDLKENYENNTYIFNGRQIQNKYNYSFEFIKEKYNYLIESIENSENNGLEKGELLIFHLEKTVSNESLGLSLSGNVNLNKTSVFVCDIYENSIAQKSGIKIGDQILEINGQVIYGKAHLNVTPLIKNMRDIEIFLVVYRSSQNMEQMFKPSKNFSYVKSENGKFLIDQIKTNESKIELYSDPESNRSNNSLELSESLLCSSFETNHFKQQNFKSDYKNIQKKEQNGCCIDEEKNKRLFNQSSIKKETVLKDKSLEVDSKIQAINNSISNTFIDDDSINYLESNHESVELEILNKDSFKNSQKNSAIEFNNFFSKNYEKEKYGDHSKKPNKILFNSFIYGDNTQSNQLEIKNNEYLSQLKNDDPKTNVIKIGHETWIEIERKKNGLGLSIVGGSDTQIPGIIIHDIYKNGAAFNDNRLSIGDQILKVNNIDLVSVTHDQALNILRQTSDIVRLLIHRSFSFSEKNLQKKIKNNLDNLNNNYNEKFMEVINIELSKKFGKGLGFSIIGRTGGSGVFISHIIDGGCADRDGRLAVGDLILEVNNQDIRKSNYNDAAFLLKTLPQGKVDLKIGRFKVSIKRSREISKTSPNELTKFQD